MTKLIMASVHRRLLVARSCWPKVVLAAATLAVGSPALANDTLPYQPPCPVLASPANEASLQPMRIAPQQVKAKNAMGCLSPTDAIYGPDGCPLRFCGSKAGVFKLP